MSGNNERLNEQLFNVVADEKVSDEARLKKLKYLVRLGADVNARLYGKSVLSKAIEQNAGVEVIEFLREKGAEESVISKEEALEVSQGFWDENGKIKSVEEIKELLKKGADVGARDRYGETALIEAVRKGKLDVVKCLAENGTDLEAKDMHGRTALIKAAMEGHIEVVKCLAEYGADVNAKCEDGETALLRAAARGHIEVVKYLVENGADVNVKDSVGRTALIRAAIWGDLDVVKCLAECGADVNAKVEDGRTVLDIAKKLKKADCLKFLEELQQKGEPKVEVLSGEEKNATVKKRGMWQRIFGGRD